MSFDLFNNKKYGTQNSIIDLLAQMGDEVALKLIQEDNKRRREKGLPTIHEELLKLVKQN
jgi:hypothetical protein